MRRAKAHSTTAGPASADDAGAPPLAPVIDERLDRLASVLRKVLAEGGTDAVHDLRVVTRRLQQLLAVLSPAPRPKRVRRLCKSLRRIRSALGPWRNYDVCLDIVAKRGRSTRSPRKRAAWTLIREHLEHRRVEETIQARRRILAEEPETLPERLRGALADLFAGRAPREVREAVLTRVEGAWREWQQKFDGAQEHAVASVHALRISTKRLRYRLELAEPLDEAAARPALEWAKGVQQVLGDWHDRQILQGVIAEALARREVLLDHLETAEVALAEVRRERSRAQLANPRIPFPAWLEEGRRALEGWLRREAASRP